MAIKSGDMKTIYMGYNDAQLHFKDENLNTALHYAMAHNEPIISELVIKKMRVQDLTAPNILDQTPLHIAIENNNGEAIKMMAGQEIDFYSTNYKELNLFQYAKELGSKDALKALKQIQ